MEYDRVMLSFRLALNPHAGGPVGRRVSLN